MSDSQRVPPSVRMIRRYFPKVDRVAEATKPIEIEVTSKDLDGAKKKSENGCVMANACGRLPGVDGAIIKPSFAYVIRGTLAIRYKTPVSVAREIVSFDRHKDFRIGTYHLSRVSKSQTLENNRKGRAKGRPRGRNTGAHSKHRVYHRTAGMRGLTPKDGVK